MVVKTMVKAGLGISNMLKRLDDFILMEHIGQGGMGEVYKAYQESLNRVVAIKVLREEYAADQDFLARFKLEAQSAARLIHPNIVQVFQMGNTDGEYYFAMEYIEGKDLDAIIKESNDLMDLDETLKIILSVAKALVCAADNEIVHRDIKPSNIIMSDSGEIKVMDFGLAKTLKSYSDMTTMGQILGTAKYMAPEQAEGKEVDFRTDIYALGIMFFHLLTGELPFSGDNASSLAFQHVHTKPVDPIKIQSDIPKALNDICIKCIKKNKEDRYSHPKFLVEDLEKVLDDSRINTFFQSKEERKNKKSTLIISVILLVLLIVSLGVYNSKYFKTYFNQNIHSELAVDSEKPNGKRVQANLSNILKKLPTGSSFQIDQHKLNASNVDKGLDLPIGETSIEIHHPLFNSTKVKITVDAKGVTALQNSYQLIEQRPLVTQRIKESFSTSNKKQLEQLGTLPLSTKSLSEITESINTLTLEEKANALYKRNLTSATIEAFNTLMQKEQLSTFGKTLLSKIKIRGKLDKKIALKEGFFQTKNLAIIANSIGMKFKEIEAGDFLMGSSQDRRNQQRKVILSKNFFLSQYEVTNKEFRQYKESHNSNSDFGHTLNKDKQPVVSVSWEDAVGFCKWLSKKEKDLGRSYRLPTEAEWEYCLRCKTNTNKYSWGNLIEKRLQTSNLFDQITSSQIDLGKKPFLGNDQFRVTAPVGSFKPNRFGIYDMEGNVKEWVSDYFASKRLDTDQAKENNDSTNVFEYISSEEITEGIIDPHGPDKGKKRCFRGSSYKTHSDIKDLMSHRKGLWQDSEAKDLGFRIILKLNPAMEKDK